MTRKEQILRMIAKLPDDVSFDKVIYHLDVLKSVEISLEQIARGEVITHEELEKKLRDEGWLDEPKSSGPKKPKKTTRKSSATSGTATRRKQPGSLRAGSIPQ